MPTLFTQLAEAILNRTDIPTPGPTTEAGIITNILNAAYFWAGVVAIALFIYGAFMYVISDGDAARVKTAKNTLLYAVIGLIIVLLAFSITAIVISGVNQGA